MSYPSPEDEGSDAGTSNVNILDVSLADPRINHDITVYKDVIKRLQEELSKIKTENERLTETVLAYSLKLPQLSRKLNTLVSCLEAKASRLNGRRKPTSHDEAEDSLHSSEESSLNGANDADCELKDDASEEDVGQRDTTATNEGVRQSVQNFVEVICEEENSVENASSTSGVTSNLTTGHTDYKSATKVTPEVTAERNTKANTVNPRLTFRNRKLRKLKSVATSKVRHTREGIIKKPLVNKKNKSAQENLNEEPQLFNVTAKEKKLSLDEKEIVDPRIKLELSPEATQVIEEDGNATSKHSKFQNLLQETVNSVVSNQETTRTSQCTNNDAPDLSRRGRRRAYDCEVCGRTFARSSNLAHHVMRHRNERPHRCEICDRAFVQKANLKVHLRSHTGERPFSCTECGRAFAQKNNALRHLRAHARQRQLQEQKLVCPVCGKTFGRWPSYETHMRRTHSNIDSNSGGSINHCIVENVVGDSHRADAVTSGGEISAVHPDPGATISHHVVNTITNSQLRMETSDFQNVHPSSVDMVNVHTSDSISNGHIASSHHSQHNHLLVRSHASMSAQLSGVHGCTDAV